MTNFEKIYQKVALKIINLCHGAIKISKRGKIIEVYDVKRHIWSDGLAGLIIKDCLLYTSPSPRDVEESRMPSSA